MIYFFIDLFLETLFVFFLLILSFSFSKKLKKTPLHYAAENGREQIVNNLLERGANIEALDEVFLFEK